MLVLVEVDVLMILIGNWPCDDVFLQGSLFCWCSLKIYSPVDDLFEKLIKNCKVRLQINLTVRGGLIYNNHK